MRTLGLFVAVIAITACGNGDTTTPQDCGVNGACPTGYTCNPASNKCVATGSVNADAPATTGGADAAAGGTADAATGGTPDAASSSGTPDAAPSGTTPTVSIASPAENAHVKPTFMVTFTSQNAASFTCDVDSTMTVSCTSAGASVGPLSEGAHTFHVVAHSADSVDSTPATLHFTADGTPPTVSASLAGAAANTGLATFTLTSSETLGGATATIDGQPCTVSSDFTTATCTFLAPGDHAFAAVGTDLAGNASTPALASATVTYGPSMGHLVLMGHGFHVAATGPRVLLGNALALAPVTQLTDAKTMRPLRVLYYDHGQVDSTEKANVLAAVQMGLAQHGLSYDAADSEEFGASGDEAQIATKLKGKDALVIYNQGAATGLATVAATFSAPLASYLAAGGIVIVTDGWYGDSKTPSQSYQVIDASLLTIASASLGTSSVTVNEFMTKGAVDSDPIVAGVGSSYSTDAADPAINYVAPQAGGIADFYAPGIATIDKIFAAPARGPVTVTLVDVNAGVLTGSIVAQTSDGSVDGAVYTTNSDGVVQRSVDAGGMVTVAFRDSNSWVLETVVAVQPFVTLQLGTSSGQDPNELPNPSYLEVDMPDKDIVTYQGATATQYRAAVLCPINTRGTDVITNMTGCGTNQTAVCSTPNNTGKWMLPYWPTCLNAAGKLDVELRVQDSTGASLAIQLLRDQTADTTPKTAASWKSVTPGPNYTLTITNPPAGAAGAAGAGLYRADSFLTGGDGRDFKVPFALANEPVPLLFPANADSIGDATLVDYGQNQGGSLLIHINQPLGGTSKTVDLAANHLPKVAFTLGGTATRPTISYAPVQDAVNGAAAILTWQVNTHFWGFVYPSSIATVTAPQLPAAFTGFAPTSSAALELAAAVVVDTDLFTGYDDWLAHYWFPNTLLPVLDATGPATFRASAVGSANIFVPIGN
jgi:hypothetical protein